MTGSQVELATQAIEVTYEYTAANGEVVREQYNLADPTVYGFFPGNSESMVTFTDSVASESSATKSSFDTGDVIYIKTVDEDGNLLTNVYVSVQCVPNSGAGAVLRTWSAFETVEIEYISSSFRGG